MLIKTFHSCAGSAGDHGHLTRAKSMSNNFMFAPPENFLTIGLKNRLTIKRIDYLNDNKNVTSKHPYLYL